jgi:tetratricopeptide (TPR) repeat protein
MLSIKNESGNGKSTNVGRDGAHGKWRCHRRHRPRRADGTCAVKCQTTVASQGSASAIANRALFRLRLLIFIALAAALAGCDPAGNRALLKGKQLLDEGNYSDAADEFKAATEDLATNAEAWNYLGVAEQHTGQYDDAAKAYQRALELDRDLMEAHFNLGCLWMQEDKPDKAVSEFTAFTLRKVNQPDGWLKLGLAQLRTRDLIPAEKSFSTALYWSPNNAEALNGLGMARMERGRPEEAQKFFQAAVQNHPDFGPAILNLATVEHEYLHDDRQALHDYLAYLSLNPRPANSDDVNAIVNSLEGSPAVAMAASSQTPPNSQIRQPAPSMEPDESTYEPPKQQQKRREHRRETARANTDNTASEDQSDTGQGMTESVQVPPEKTIASTPASGGLRPASEPDVYRSNEPAPPSNQSSGGGFFHWLHSDQSPSSSQVTPLEPQNTQPAPAPAAVPVRIVQPAPPVFPSYIYLSPPKPVSGNRRAASAMFNRAREYEGERRFSDALEYYRQAASLDPAWFEAQYNCGVMAYRLRDYQFSSVLIAPWSCSAKEGWARCTAPSGSIPNTRKTSP